MKKMRQICFILSTLSQLSGPMNSVAEAKECTPAYRQVGYVAFEMGQWKISLSFLVFGCSEGLQALTRSDLSVLRKSMKELSKQPLGLALGHMEGQRVEEREFRRRVVEHLNKSLSEETITDVLVVNYRRHEILLAPP